MGNSPTSALIVHVLGDLPVSRAHASMSSRFQIRPAVT